MTAKILKSKILNGVSGSISEIASEQFKVIINENQIDKFLANLYELSNDKEVEKISTSSYRHKGKIVYDINIVMDFEGEDDDCWEL